MSKGYENAITFAVLAAVLIFLAAPVLADEGSGEDDSPILGASVSANADISAGSRGSGDDSADDSDDSAEDNSKTDDRGGERARAGVGAGVGIAIKERYENAREKYLDARGKAKERLDEFNSIKARFRLAASVEKLRKRSKMKTSAL